MSVGKHQQEAQGAVRYVRWHPKHGFNWKALDDKPYGANGSWRSVALFTTPPAPVDVRAALPKPDWLYWYQRTVWWTAKAKEFGYDPDNGIFYPGDITTPVDVRLHELADKWERWVAHNTTDEGCAFRHCATDLRALLDGQPAGVVIDDAMVRRAVHAYDEWMIEHAPDETDAYHDGIRVALQAALGGGVRS